MKANYTPSILYSDNPFIEALPQRMSNDTLIQSITSNPDKAVCDIATVNTNDRLILAAKVNEVFLPQDKAILVYGMIYQCMISSYASKDSVIDAKQTGLIKTAQNNRQLSNTGTFITQAESGSVLGLPGTGKTSTIMRILSTFPQVIEHTEYNGHTLFCKQITYITIQCPGDCSVKSACVYILSQIDKAVGSIYTTKKRSTMTLDAMVEQISILCLTYHIGLIVVDEIQNLIGGKEETQTGKRLAGFFVHLMNETGVGVLLVGTPEAEKMFVLNEHLSRRTRGVKLTALDYIGEFSDVCEAMWKQIYVLHQETLSGEIKRILFDISNGIPALLAKTLYYAQQYAITTGVERITAKVLRETAETYRLSKPKITSRQSSFKLSTTQTEKERSEKRNVSIEDDDDLIELWKVSDNIIAELEKRAMIENV